MALMSSLGHGNAIHAGAIYSFQHETLGNTPVVSGCQITASLIRTSFFPRDISCSTVVSMFLLKIFAAIVAGYLN